MFSEMLPAPFYLFFFVGNRWHSHRKLITPTFHFNILESFLEVFVRRSKELMTRLKEKEGNNSFDISPYTQRLTLDFICGKILLIFQK